MFKIKADNYILKSLMMGEMRRGDFDLYWGDVMMILQIIQSKYLYMLNVLIYTWDNMVQAVINIKDRTNRVLNIVKAKYGLRDKSQAIELVIEKYEAAFLEPELRPEYVEKLEKIRKGKYTRYKSVEELRKATS